MVAAAGLLLCLGCPGPSQGNSRQPLASAGVLSCPWLVLPQGSVPRSSHAATCSKSHRNPSLTPLALLQVVGKRVPPDQLMSLLLAMFEGLADPDKNCSRAATVMINSLLKERGSVLQEKVSCAQPRGANAAPEGQPWPGLGARCPYHVRSPITVAPPAAGLRGDGCAGTGTVLRAGAGA